MPGTIWNPLVVQKWRSCLGSKRYIDQLNFQLSEAKIPKLLSPSISTKVEHCMGYYTYPGHASPNKEGLRCRKREVPHSFVPHEVPRGVTRSQRGHAICAAPRAAPTRRDGAMATPSTVTTRCSTDGFGGKWNDPRV